MFHLQTESRGMNRRSPAAFSSLSLGPHPMGWCHPHSGWILPLRLMCSASSLTVAPKLISIVILYPIKLIIQMTHLTLLLPPLPQPRPRTHTNVVTFFTSAQEEAAPSETSHAVRTSHQSHGPHPSECIWSSLSLSPSPVLS